LAARRLGAALRVTLRAAGFLRFGAAVLRRLGAALRVTLRAGFFRFGARRRGLRFRDAAARFAAR
jgi:hypothetical protein